MDSQPQRLAVKGKLRVIWLYVKIKLKDKLGFRLNHILTPHSSIQSNYQGGTEAATIFPGVHAY